MLNKIKRFFFPEKKTIVLLDGDQSIHFLLNSIHQHNLLGNEILFIRSNMTEAEIPRKLKGLPLIQVNLLGYRARKETTDKFIGIKIQQVLLSKKYKEIIVVSNDLDFIDIFLLVIKVNKESDVKDIEFTLIRNSENKQLVEKTLQERTNNKIRLLITKRGPINNDSRTK